LQIVRIEPKTMEASLLTTRDISPSMWMAICWACGNRWVRRTSGNLTYALLPAVVVFAHEARAVGVVNDHQLSNLARDALGMRS
jgi:hypothetical protein